MTHRTNRALILVFFGTTADPGLAVYTQIEDQMRLRYPQMQVCRAFTSQMVIRRLAERGMHVPNLPEQLAELKRQGVNEAVVLPLLIVPGQEYGKITAALAAEKEIRTVCAAPLMTTEADIDAVIGALEADMPADMPVVVGCHGNEQHDHYNREIRLLAAKIEARHPQAMVVAVEGDNPGTAALARAREMADKAGAVHIIPLMLVAGDHVMNDMLGDEPDSWKSQIGAARTTCSVPAGLNSRMLDLYCAHLDTALATINGGTP